MDEEVTLPLIREVTVIEEDKEGFTTEAVCVSLEDNVAGDTEDRNEACWESVDHVDEVIDAEEETVAEDEADALAVALDVSLEELVPVGLREGVEEDKVVYDLYQLIVGPNGVTERGFVGVIVAELQGVFVEEGDFVLVGDAVSNEARLIALKSLPSRTALRIMLTGEEGKEDTVKSFPSTI